MTKTTVFTNDTIFSGSVGLTTLVELSINNENDNGGDSLLDASAILF